MPEAETGDTPSTNKRRPRLWKRPLRVLIVLLLAFAIFRFVVHQRVQTRLNAIRAAGYPVTMAELHTWYPTPEGPNAAEVYQRAFDALVEDEAIESDLPFIGLVELPEPGDRLDGILAGKIRTYLEKNADSIALLEEAARIEDARYPCELERDGLDATLPHIGKLRAVSRLLMLQAALSCDQGDSDRFVDMATCILAAARSLEKEPVLISAYSSLSIHRFMNQQIEYTIQTHLLNDDQLKTLDRSIFTAKELRVLLHRALVGERSLGNTRFNGIGSQHEWDQRRGYEKCKMIARRILGIEDLDNAYWLDCWPIRLEYAERPTWPPRNASWYPDPPPSIYTESHCQCDTLEISVFRTLWQGIAESKVMRVGIAAERYRLRHGRLPEQLNELVPDFLSEVPKDPFDGQPLRYRVEKDGVIIYSIGPDETDQGGRRYEDDGGKPEMGVDITFTFGGLQDKLWPIKERPADAGYGGMGIGEYAESIEQDETGEDNTEASQP